MDNTGVIEELIQNNCALLKVQSDLLHSIEKQLYTTRQQYFLNSSIGGHVRHILDHYSAFADALENKSGLIDYEKRIRGTDIETDPQTAATKSSELEQYLSAATRQMPEFISMRNESSEPHKRIQLSSCPERELSFLLSHTVHHHAIIAAILSCAQVRLPPQFGFAPSTIRHHAAVSECAQ